jgi:hypothetical protein
MSQIELGWLVGDTSPLHRGYANAGTVECGLESPEGGLHERAVRESISGVVGRICVCVLVLVGRMREWLQELLSEE